MLKTEELILKDAVYSATQMMPKKAIFMGMRVMKVIGAFAGASKLAGPKDGSKFDLSDEASLDALSKAFKSVDPAEITELMDDLVRCASKGNKAINGLNDFMGEDGTDFESAARVVFLVLRVNFSGAIAKLGFSMPGPKTATPANSLPE